MFIGLALKIVDIPGYTPAFIIGAILMIFARLHQRRKTIPAENS